MDIVEGELLKGQIKKAGYFLCLYRGEIAACKSFSSDACKERHHLRPYNVTKPYKTGSILSW